MIISFSTASRPGALPLGSLLSASAYSSIINSRMSSSVLGGAATHLESIRGASLHLVSGHLGNSWAASSNSLPATRVPGEHLLNFLLASFYGRPKTSLSTFSRSSDQARSLLARIAFLSAFLAELYANRSYSLAPSLQQALWYALFRPMHSVLFGGDVIVPPVRWTTPACPAAFRHCQVVALRMYWWNVSSTVSASAPSHSTALPAFSVR